MNQMVGDLLDFTRGRFGSAMPITRTDTDLATVVRHAVEELSVARPERVVQFTPTGDLRGDWDCPRITQMVTNLLGNAMEHGAPESMINLTAQGESDEVVLRIHNYGPAIPRSDLAMIFSPFKRGGAADRTPGEGGNLGLGLYITERIVSAHGGQIDVRSSPEAGTLFTVRLPRAAA